MVHRSRLQLAASRLQVCAALAGVGLVVYVAGWKEDLRDAGWLLESLRVASWGFGAGAGLEWFFAERRGEFARERWLTLLLAGSVSVMALFETSLSGWLHQSLSWLGAWQWLLVIVAALQVSALAARVGEAVPWIERRLFRRLSPGSLLVVAFSLLILAGAGLLCMPNATTQGIGFLDALFTSASAVCVTGLIVVDTATAFTPLGQLIVMGLIQLGGLGIVTLTYFIAMVGGQGVGISSRVFLRDLLNSENLGRLGTAIGFILATTLLCEAVGAILLYQSWQDNGIEGNLGWLAAFHSVSAFCNAGFSLFSAGLADGRVSEDWGGLSVLLVLIALGGIGFPVLRALWLGLASRFRKGKRGERRKRWLGLHVRLALVASLALWVGGFLLLWLASSVALNASLGDGAGVALFRSVSARTAGFNIADIGAMSHAGAAVLMLLMFVGGSPGGMAGGIKTTTFSVALMNLLRILRRRRRVTLFEREIPESSLQRAFAVVLLSMLWILFASAAIMIAQPELDFLDTLFETVSAFSTVGLSRGMTGDLEPFGKVVIILTMLVGRIGILNFFLSLLPESPEPRVRYPSGSVIVE